MSDAPERLALRKAYMSHAITSGPLMEHPDYIHYVRADRIEELERKLAKAVTRLQHIAANKTTGELTVIEWDTYDMFALLDACISEARTTLAELTSSEAAYGEAKGGKDE